MMSRCKRYSETYIRGGSSRRYHRIVQAQLHSVSINCGINTFHITYIANAGIDYSFIDDLVLSMTLDRAGVGTQATAIALLAAVKTLTINTALISIASSNCQHCIAYTAESHHHHDTRDTTSNTMRSRGSRYPTPQFDVALARALDPCLMCRPVITEQNSR